MNKEKYLDDLAFRISGMKMDGSPVAYAKLLGADLQRGAELFGLQEFAPEVQTDILLNLASFMSGGNTPEVAQSEPKHPAHADTQSLNEGQQEHRSAGYHI